MEMAEGCKVVVVIPTYKEAKNIANVIQSVFNTGLENLKVLVVDDGSPDGTAEIVAEISKKDNRVMLLNRGAKKGLGSAYHDGFRIALQQRPEAVVSMDADGSHPAELLPRLIESLEKGADAVIASRYVEGGKWAAGFRRMIVSRGANLLARIATGLKLRDMTSGYRAYSARAVEHLIEKPFERGYVFQVELAYRLSKAGFKIDEVPFIFKERREGRSKLSSKEIILFFIWCVKTFLKRLFKR
ncbi:MAG: polyprenol monophosphomannose synthase [Candidatus Caldarchaeum sp.]|nr:polyprenol monophosphomannose synthase [Candidatus Caldarchaeum sp.]MDW8435975.1 polyprenol monophosphomannose synthase [Candidatus Caldarchaeum sp.]